MSALFTPVRSCFLTVLGEHDLGLLLALDYQEEFRGREGVDQLQVHQPVDLFARGVALLFRPNPNRSELLVRVLVISH